MNCKVEKPKCGYLEGLLPFVNLTDLQLLPELLSFIHWTVLVYFPRGQTVEQVTSSLALTVLICTLEVCIL